MSVDFNTNAAYFRHVLRRRALHCLAVCFLGFLSGCPSIQAQEATLERVASDLSEQLSKTKQKHFSPKILVTDFPLQSLGINSLGETLASQLSDALVHKLGSASVIERNRLHGYLQAKEISPFDLGDSDIAAWIAGQIGATAMVFGKLTFSGEKLKLSADLIRLENGKKLASSKINLPLTDELRQLASTPLAWSSSPDVFMPCRAGVGETTLDSFKAAGLTMPTCIHCPDPTYTDEARRAKVQANVKFDVVVDEQGRPKRIAVVRGDTFGLTAKAMEAIRKWQFNPSMKEGKPVAVCVVVDVGFRIF